MAQVGHHTNLVSIIGVISRGDPLVLVLQYCEHGSLLYMLKKTASEGHPIVHEAKMRMAQEISKGMEHLAGQHFIHRDLAARNVLVAEPNICKVADFGLSRSGDSNESDDGHEDYYKSSNGVFPVRWTAPESMETMRFTPASDVWSFAIVVIEILQNGIAPYHGQSNPDVMKLVMSGGKHEKPEGCSETLYKLLLKCWETDPSNRPSFTLLAKRFAAMAGEDKIGGTTKVAADEFESSNNEYSDFGFGGANAGAAAEQPPPEAAKLQASSESMDKPPHFFLSRCCIVRFSEQLHYNSIQLKGTVLE